jgi:uncharacterized protein (TIGR03437 family)
MRLLTLLTLLMPTLLANVIAFEQRTPTEYRALRLTIRPSSLALGAVTLRFANPSSSARIEPIGPAAPATYFTATKTQTFPQFSKLAIRGLYAGIDLILYPNGDHLEYDLLLAPRADPNLIRIALDGAHLDAQGNLNAHSLIQLPPRVVQSGHRIPASYALLSNRQFAIRLGPYNRNRPVTIDPELVFTKFFGGSGADTATAIATDAQGNIYIAGTSNSVDFPTTTGVQPRLAAPVAVIAGGAAAATPLPVSTETSVLGIGGTPNGSAIYAVTADAVYVTSDRGATWIAKGPLPGTGAVNNYPTINNISVDAIDPSRVFIATNRGIFFSGDGGQSWFLHEAGLPVDQNAAVNATAVLVSPVDHSIVYAATPSPAALFKSTDAGNTFAPLNPTYPGKPQPSNFSNYVIALGSNGVDLFVVDPSGVLLKSTDGGATWQKLGSPGVGALSLLLDSVNPSNIHVVSSSAIQKSVDGGATFTTLVAFPLGSISGTQFALDSRSATLYLGRPSIPIQVISTSTGNITTLQSSTPNLHALVAIGSQVFAGFDTPASPYITKWDPTGTRLLYSTFFGGTGQDIVMALAVDAQGSSTVVGYTLSADFPVTGKLSTASPATNLPVGFVTKLNADGMHFVYSTLLGGSKSTFIQALALDNTGAVYVTGQTAAPEFPLSPHAFQTARPQAVCNRPNTNIFLQVDNGANGFVSKISPDGTQIIYSTLLTGSCGSMGFALAVNAAGELTLAGNTTSSDFPVTSGAYQSTFPGDPAKTAPPNVRTAGFAARISASGDRVLAATYLGGSYSTDVSAVALDRAGNVLLTGSTAKILPGATPRAYQPAAVDTCAPTINIGPGPPYGGTNDAFVLKLDPALTTAGFLTYLGGACNDAATGIALDASGNAWVNGFTSSPDFPIKSPFQAAGLSPYFVSEISADGSQLLFSSATDGTALVIDPAGGVHMAGIGFTSTVPKRVRTFGQIGRSAEWIKIDPAAAPALIIDNVQPFQVYSPQSANPLGLGPGLVPGELVLITGRNLGPATQANAQLDANGRLPFALAGITVHFENTPAPLVSVNATTIICYAPFEISQTTNVTVQANGQRSNSVKLGVTASDPQILAVVNQDGTLNSATRPARAGDELILYTSGLGQTNPLSADGLINTAPFAIPLASPTLYAGGVRVQPLFIGAAPGQIAGIVQINFRLPSAMSSNPTYINLNSANAPIYILK